MQKFLFTQSVVLSPGFEPGLLPYKSRRLTITLHESLIISKFLLTQSGKFGRLVYQDMFSLIDNPATSDQIIASIRNRTGISCLEDKRAVRYTIEACWRRDSNPRKVGFKATGIDRYPTPAG